MSPSVNDTYGLTVKGGYPIKFVKAKGKEYFLCVKKYVHYNNFNIHANILLKVEVIITFATKHRNDLDNRLKSLFDSLTRADVWEDDSLINELHVYRGPISKPGGIVVKISEYIEQ